MEGFVSEVLFYSPANGPAAHLPHRSQLYHGCATIGLDCPVQPCQEPWCPNLVASCLVGLSLNLPQCLELPHNSVHCHPWVLQQLGDGALTVACTVQFEDGIPAVRDCSIAIEMVVATLVT